MAFEGHFAPSSPASAPPVPPLLPTERRRPRWVSMLATLMFPNALRRRVRNLLRLRLAHREDERLRTLSISLPKELLQNVRVLPDREALLDHLPAGGVVAEVGVASGDFSHEILQRCTPRRHHLIDRWGSSRTNTGQRGYEQVVTRFRAAIDHGQVVVDRGTSWEVLSEFPDEYFDWLYVDAGHDYDSVMKDLLAARPKIKADGLIAGHDYVRWARLGDRFGVVEAVNRFCVTSGFEMVFLTADVTQNASFAIRRGRTAK